MTDEQRTTLSASYQLTPPPKAAIATDNEILEALIARTLTDRRNLLDAVTQAVRAIEALAELKNPRSVAFVQQANITTGPQQINNGTISSARAGENENEQNKQAKQARQISTNPGAQTVDERVGAELDAMAEVDRSENSWRQA